jgi:hypothetical protein
VEQWNKNLCMLDMRSDELCVIIEYKCIDLWPLMF